MTHDQYQLAASDYQLSLRLSARDSDWDTDDERKQDGATHNPYAAWEWGSAVRLAGDSKRAAQIHVLATDCFTYIANTERSVLSELDAGIDYAAAAAATTGSTNAST